MRRIFALGALGAVVLAGCSNLAPIQQDQPLMLAAGDGIAAVQFDTLDHLTQIQIVSDQPSGATLDIPSVPAGKSTYLFEVPAGRYCLQRFSYGSYLIFHKGEYVNCFKVTAGEVGFSGIYTPRAENGGIVTTQDLDVSAAKDELRRDFPHIATQFLQPEPAPLPAAPTPLAPGPAAAPATPNVPPAAGKDLVSTWVTHDDGAHTDTIFVRNNTKWNLQITSFELYDCANIKQACKPTRPAFALKPHETRSFMQVQPDDLNGAYSFHYRFGYGFN